jgi:vanillate O-demethylase monooxygenase subunit
LFVKKAWYVAAREHEVSAEGILARTLVDVPLPLCRDAKGEAGALQERRCQSGARSRDQVGRLA